jgi:hypothetical protein
MKGESENNSSSSSKLYILLYERKEGDTMERGGGEVSLIVEQWDCGIYSSDAAAVQ